jgi:CubicO group peptidase (beta-lactamase class C family)
MKQRAGLSPLGRAWTGVGCALWLLTSVSSAQEPPAEPPAPRFAPLSDELWAELDGYVASARVAFDVPGAAVALIQNGQVEHIGTYGVLGVDDPVPVDAETLFMIGSVTKSMTTTLAAALVSEGRLDWDDAVSDYLPGFALSNPDWTPLVRIRDALGHTSGVPRSDLSLFVDFHRPLGLTDSIADIPALAAPGERFEYQNQVFAVGGFALARAAGARNRNADIARTYQRLMQKRVFQPLGMARTTFDFEAAIRDDNHAAPHAFDPATSVASAVPIGFERFALPVAPAGAAWASIDDMARYFAMHLREGESVDGARVVSAAELLETHTAQTVLDGDTGYGLGWGVSETAKGKLLAHGGGTAGFTSQVLGLTALDFGVVILTNSVGGGPFISAVNQRLTDLAFGLPLRGDADLLAAIAEQKAALAELIAALGPVDAESVADYLGRYERGLTVAHAGDELLIETVYGALQFRSVPGVDGLFVCTTDFFVGVLAQLLTDERGRATLSLGFGFENGALVDPLVVARLGDAARPRHRGHRAGDAQRAFDWHKLSNARRWNHFRHHPNGDLRVSGPGLQ